MFHFRGARHTIRSYSTIILIFATLCSTFIAYHFYRKSNSRPELIQNVQSSIITKTRTSTLPTITKVQKLIDTGIIA